jgi:hypothetical protein
MIISNLKSWFTIALLLTVVEKGVKGQRKATKARNSEYNGESFVLKES